MTRNYLERKGRKDLRRTSSTVAMTPNNIIDRTFTPFSPVCWQEAVLRGGRNKLWFSHNFVEDFLKVKNFRSW